MSSNIPEMLGELDKAIRGLWAKGVEELQPINVLDFLYTTKTYHRLTELRKEVRGCLKLLDDLRLKLSALLPDEAKGTPEG